MAVARDRTLHDQSHMAMAMPSLVHHEEGAHHSVINFETINHGLDTSGSGDSNVLSFEQHKPQLAPPHQDEYWMWEENLITGIGTDQPSSSDDFSSCSKDTGAFGWLYSEATNIVPAHHCIQEQESSFLHKRPHLGENSNMQSMKKQCTGNGTAKNKQKPKERTSSVLASKDPQSIAAKNRRERISERLKVLQELVPNGTKVDLVTMLEKAIGYVKFLQLQVKVLGTDEFWPVQGGKAPDISQVKEAIDAILSSQRDSRNSSSSSKS